MVFLYPLPLTTKDDNHETPLEIAVANSSYPEIIKLLSITNLDTLDQDELDRQYASEEYHVGQALKLIHAEDWPACIEFLDSKKPDDQFIFELLSYNLCGTTIIHEIAICSQKYHDDLVFLLLLKFASLQMEYFTKLTIREGIGFLLLSSDKMKLVCSFELQ